ncbi:glycosyltransferase [Microbulbifer sp. MCCC 1A16149]|uniref:glycosyltransferase n=1 Tax=Microbulbifer sp. MCCC 1A16149 TaxID=3411322 RepID=UPI003D0B5025
MSLKHRKIGVSALLTDPFIQEARSRTIWAANTCSACVSAGAQSFLIANASETPIPYQKKPEWVQKEVARFYGVDTTNILPTFNPNKYYKKGAESFIYDYLLKTSILPQLTDVHTRDPILAARAIEAGKGVIFEDHDEDAQVNARKRIMELSHSEHFKAIVCITEKIRDAYYLGPVKKSKLICMDSGVQNFANDDSIFSSLKRDGRGRPPTIGYAGGLQPERDIETIFQAAKLLPYYKFILIGGRQALIDKLIEQAVQLDIYNIDFLGYLKSQDMRRILASRCDVLLYSRASGYSTENSSPLKLFEYFNYNKPIVSAETSVTLQYLGIKGVYSYQPSSVTSLVGSLKAAVEFGNKNSVDEDAYELILSDKSWGNRQKKILEFAGILV